MTRKRAVVMMRMDAPPSMGDKWKSWYETEYLSRRLELPGFLAARLYERAEMLPEQFVVPGPRYLSVIELASVDAVSGKEYVDLAGEEQSAGPESLHAINATAPSLTGGLFEQIFPEETTYVVLENAPFLLAVGHAGIPREVEGEYHDWYNTEHIPSYLEIPGILTARRFRRVKPDDTPFLGVPVEGPDYIALYDLADEHAFESEEFRQRSKTPWSTRIRGYTWERRKLNDTYCCVFRKAAR